MATIATQTITQAGLDPVYVSADVGGDDFANTGNEFIHIKNEDASPMNLTIITPRTVEGLAIADLVIVIPAGEERFIGPFSTYTFAASGVTSLTYSSVTSLTLAIFKPGT